ncbi:hypothetical protein ACM39_05080 [Chryseobacterium sp. FH2]|nr:hypothetical protein ACM39_05080 [Chryseobacterium sp. FH2]
MIICKSQTINVRGIVEDSLKINSFIGINVNDTIRKFRDRQLKDKAFKEKNPDGYDKLIKNKDLFTSPDSVGNYTINAKLTDTLYFYKWGYTTKKYKVEDIINNNIKVVLKPRPCIPYKKCDQQNPSKLYAFVGKKIDVSYIDQSKYCGVSLSTEYKAEYNITQEFGDHYPDSTIIFTAYDHNSMYEYDFRNYDNILIFVGEYCGDLIKDYFFPVYKTIDGRWATPVDIYMEHYYKSEKFSPLDITFDHSVNFDLSDYSSVRIEYKFPKEYYKIKNGKAYPIKGRYAEDLVKLWKEISTKNQK